MGSSPIISIFRTLFFSLRFHFIFLSSPKACFSSLLFFPCSLICFQRLCPGVEIINFKIFLIIYSKNIQTFRRIACYTKYIRNARMFNNYPSTLFENPKILKKIAPYHLVRSFSMNSIIFDFLYHRLHLRLLISGSVLPGLPQFLHTFPSSNNIRPFRSGGRLLC